MLIMRPWTILGQGDTKFNETKEAHHLMKDNHINQYYHGVWLVPQGKEGENVREDFQEEDLARKKIGGRKAFQEEGMAFVKMCG